MTQNIATVGSINTPDISLQQQVYSIPLDDGRYLIYAPLKGIAFIGNAPLVNAILDRYQSPGKSSNIIEFIENLNFFSPEPYPVDEYQHDGVQYDAVILFLTNQCNLRCSYCYASSGDYPKKMMPWEIAKAGIDRMIQDVRKHHSQAMTLGFHGGGEPTLNWDIFTKSVAYTRALSEQFQIPLHISGAFNGYWSKTKLRYILQNLTELSLSFDGLPTVQNRQRPARGKIDSFTKVATTLHALDDAHFPYGIRMTVTNESVDCLAESIAFICEQFRPQKIQVEPVFQEGRARKQDFAITDPNRLISQFIKGYAIANQHQITLFYSGARLEVLNTRFCLAACRALVITPEGDVTTCFEIYGREHPLSQHFLVGHYQGNGQFNIDAEKLHHQFCRTVQQLSYCAGCFCRWHCAGDCAVKTFSNEMIDEFQPSDRCRVNQELTKFLLLDKIQTHGGVLWANQ